MAKYINIFFIGDINGKPGTTLISTLLKQYIQKYEINFCVVNGENATEGKGIDEADAKALFELGVHVITTGNHLWDRWQAKTLISKERNICARQIIRRKSRQWICSLDLKEKGHIGVINLQGRTFMQTIDDLFKAADWALSRIANETKVVSLICMLKPPQKKWRSLGISMGE